MFYLMSSQTCFLQNGGIITFDQDVSNKIGGYPQGAILDYMTPENIYVKVKSLIDDNTYNFVTTPSYIDGEHWEEITMSATTPWGDITGTLSNQTDLTDYVNQSKALETGSVSSDADVYADVQKYAHSTFDLSKFEVVGSPNITDDGILNLPDTVLNYVQKAGLDFSDAESIDLEFEFTWDGMIPEDSLWCLRFTNSNTSTVVNGFISNTSTFNFYIVNNSSPIYGYGSFPLQENVSNLFKLHVTTDNFEVKWYEDGVLKETFSKAHSLDISVLSNILIGYISGSYSSNGTFDLKYLKIDKNGTPIFSGNKTGIDVIKPDNYEVAGTPTISDDGIASGFSSSNYLTYILPKNISNEDEIIIEGEFNTTTTTITNVIFAFGDTYANRLILFVEGLSQKLTFAIGAGDTTRVRSEVIEFNTNYKYKCVLSNNKLQLFYKKVGETDYTATSQAEADTFLSNILKIGVTTDNSSPFIGSIDLNAFKVYVDGSLIYQPCLKIPYTESKTGSKIVDAAYRDRVLDLYEQYGYAPYYTIYEENQNFTLPMGEIYGMIERKSSGGGGLEIGDIGIAPLGVDESKGLRRYLNGSIMNINSNTQAFVDKLKSTAVVFPALTCTEEEWQSIVSSSALGQCGKFVIDETAGTVRLPKVVKLQGCLTLANISDIVDAQLPDIEFNMRAIHYGNNNGGLPDGNPLADGAAQASNQVSRMTTSGTTSAIYGADFNIKASRSSSVYEADATVQEEAVQYPYFIQIATGVENEVNITNEIELNNPYTLFESKYVQASLYNSSWLLSNGTFYSKSVYVTAYEALNVEYNSEVTAGTTVTLPSGGSYTKRGLPVKLSTDEYTDYDFVINRSNETFRLPLKNGMEGVLADTIVSNGQVIKLQGSSSEANLQGLAQNLNGICANLQMTSAIGYGDLKFGSETGLTLANSNSQQSENYNLYYYVGETVQNAALINAAMLGETIPELTQKIAVCRGIPDYSQKTEFEANTTYQLNTDSMIFWYTSGATNNAATITISANSDLSSPIIYNPFYINADGHTVLTFIVPAGYYFKVSRNMTSNAYTKSFYCPLKGGN